MLIRLLDFADLTTEYAIQIRIYIHIEHTVMARTRALTHRLKTNTKETKTLSTPLTVPRVVDADTQAIDTTALFIKRTCGSVLAPSSSCVYNS